MIRITILLLLFSSSTILAQEWSPNGKLIVFTLSLNGNDDVFTIKPDGTNLHNLTNSPGTELHASWSPDGQKIIFDSNRSGDFEIYMMNSNGSTVRQLTKSNGLDLVPTFTTRGDQVVFNSLRNGNWEIYRMDSDGANVVNLSNHPATDIMRSISYDGKYIHFDSDRDTPDGRRQGYIMQIDGTHQSRLTESEYDDRFLKKGPPNTTQIAFTSTRGEGNTRGLYLMERNGTSVKLLFDSKGEDILPAWSPDGKHIIFISDMAGERDLYMMNNDKTSLIRLTNQSSKDHY